MFVDMSYEKKISKNQGQVKEHAKEPVKPCEMMLIHVGPPC